MIKMFPCRKGDTAIPVRPTDNNSEELIAAILDVLRYSPKNDTAWTAHSIACYIREHENVNGIKPDSFDGWDIERIVMNLVARGDATYEKEVS